MKIEINNDNLYKEGAFVYAKADPALKLIINKYRQRIYYCSDAEAPGKGSHAYFERELIALGI